MLSLSKLNRRDNLRRIVSKATAAGSQELESYQETSRLSICFKVFKSPLAPLGHGAMMVIR